MRGQTAYGVGAASEMFFDKPVQKLTLDQAALLAGLPQAPSEYNPFIDRGAARRRRNEVLQAMVTAGDITQAQADRRRPPAARVKTEDKYAVKKEPYVFDYIQQAVAKDLCPKTPNNCPRMNQGGMKIYTTIDLRKQALARQAIINHESLLAEQSPEGPAAAGLASVDPTNGHILAIASSVGLQPDELRLRHPGPPPARFVVQDVRADDADPRLPRRPQRHLLQLARADRRLASRAIRTTRSTPPRTPTRATSASPRPPSCPTTPCSPSSTPTSPRRR